MAVITLEEIGQSLKQTGHYWIVFTGDSITSCEWVHPNWRDIVIYVLHNELTKFLNGNWKTVEWGIKGFNFAYDGATTKDILDKIKDILLVSPNLVIGLMGGNDSALNVGIKESVENINKISDTVIKSGSKLVWCSSTPAGVGSKKNDEYQPYAKAFLEMPEKEDFFKIDMFNVYKLYSTEKFFTFISEENPVEGIKAGELDLQHPNQLGNAYIAKVVLDRVFGITFDPDKYIEGTIKGEKFPIY